MSPRYPNRLRQLRGRRFTQEELAGLVHVNPSTYRNWEEGSHRPLPRHVRALCEVLGIEEHELGFGGPLDAGIHRPAPEKVDQDVLPAVRRSQQQWHDIRRRLAQHGAELVADARRLYDERLFMGGSDAFAPPEWIMPHPIGIQQVDLALSSAAPAALITGSEPEARLILPLHSAGHQYDRYSSALRQLDRPRLLENRVSYRLSALYVADRGTGRPLLQFGLGTYFQKVDVSETLVHEFAVASAERQRRHLHPGPAWEDLPFRALIGDPFALHRRPVLPGVVTLTLRRSGSDDAPTMLLHLRDPFQVAIGGRVHTLIPSGEFQPSSIAPASIEEDLSLWRNTVREYSEELLDMPEHDGSGGAPLNYDAWPLHRSLTNALHDESLRMYFLGLACNPLSLGVDLLTVAIFEDGTFEAAFPQVRRTNSEGRIVSDIRDGERRALRFDRDTVGELLADKQLAPSSAACLALAWAHRGAILTRS